MNEAKLEQLLIKEISGVDAGANLVDGWLVMKERGGTMLEPLRELAIHHAVAVMTHKERLAALDFLAVVKARHRETGRYVPAGNPRARPEAGMFRSATPEARSLGGRFFT